MPASIKPDNSEIFISFLASQGITLNHKEGSSDLAIVALPSSEDLSRAVGSEEKHATLLYFGDDVASDVVDLIHASIQEVMRISSFTPFSETVSSIASIGDDGARVWMLDSNNGLRQLRDRLLRQPAIRSLYDTREQHPNYIPHVTIGYPIDGQSLLSDFEETQARVVRQIRFDRIALWNGDNHDVVWRFPDRGEDAEAIHSEDLVNNFLAHLKKTTGSGEFIEANVKRDGRGRFATKAEKAELAWLESVSDLNGLDADVMNDLFEKHFDALVAETENKFGVKANAEQVSNQVRDYFKSRLLETANEIASTKPEATSPDGSAKVEYYWDKESDWPAPRVVYKDGRIVEIEHSALDDGSFLAHFGIKGMRWGIRRPRGPAGTVSSGTKTTEDDQPGSSGGKSGGGGGKGGGKERLSADAEHVVRISGKKPHEMSNRDIKEANSRAEAIKKYNELFGPNPNRELQQKVEALRLERDYQKLKAELKAMNPSTLARLGRLIKSVAPGFDTVQKAVSSKAGEKIRRSLTDAIADAMAQPYVAPPKPGRSSKKSRKSKTTYGTPTSGATNVTVSDVSVVRDYDTVYPITSLGSAAPPRGLPRGS